MVESIPGASCASTVQVFLTIFLACMMSPTSNILAVYSLSSSWVGIAIYVSVKFIFLAFIPLWILPTSFGSLSARAFWIQFGVQGAWGIVRRLIFVHYSTTLTVADSNSTSQNVSTCIPSDFPWRRLSTRECTSCLLFFLSLLVSFSYYIPK
jgi:hypothetical protein